MAKLHPRYWRIVFPGCVALGMSFFMAGAITLLNTGFDDGYFLRWAHAWVIAFPLAWFAAVLWGPVARKLAMRIVTPPPGM